MTAFSAPFKDARPA